MKRRNETAGINQRLVTTTTEGACGSRGPSVSVPFTQRVAGGGQRKRGWLRAAAAGEDPQPPGLSAAGQAGKTSDKPPKGRYRRGHTPPPPECGLGSAWPSWAALTLAATATGAPQRGDRGRRPLGQPDLKPQPFWPFFLCPQERARPPEVGLQRTPAGHRLPTCLVPDEGPARPAASTEP